MARTLAMVTRGKQEPTLQNLCYLAGVIDSDGCISIGKMKAGKQRTANPRYVLMITIVNTSEILMKWLIENFGGRYKARRKMSANHKTTFEWSFNNGKAVHILRLVKPYLLIKQDQADLGIDLIKNWVTIHGRGATTPLDEVARRESAYQQMKILNRNGPVQPQRLNPLAPVGLAG